MIQLNPPLPLSCPKGNGLAHFVIDYGLEHDLMWVIALDDGGECWTYPNPEIRFRENVSYGRTIATGDGPIYPRLDCHHNFEHVLNSKGGYVCKEGSIDWLWKCSLCGLEK